MEGMKTALTLRGSAVVLLMIGVAGCAPTGAAPTAAGQPGAPGISSPSTAPSADPVTYVPSMGGFSKIFTEAANKTGSEQLADITSVPAGTLGIFIECRGPNNMQLNLGKLGTFALSCGSKTIPNYDEIGLGSTKTDIPVAISAAPTDHWSIAVGWHAGSRGPA
jgi:hypothetical protein